MRLVAHITGTTIATWMRIPLTAELIGDFLLFVREEFANTANNVLNSRQIFE